MDRIRVLIVDDSAVIRRLVSAALSRDPALEVVGAAADGQIALTRVADLRPDLVLLDLEMPVMDGLTTLVALRKVHPRLPVIMFSRHTHRGVEATVRALTLGADDYVPKPGDGMDAQACLNDVLIPKIKLLGGRGRTSTGATPAERPVQIGARPQTSGTSALKARRIDLIVIGASTGGPNALAELLAAFPADWTVPILIVQHMPREFTTRLAERLTDKSKLTVREVSAGAMLSAAQAWVAPGDHHLLVHRTARGPQLALSTDAPENSCRPAVDPLFRSAAASSGPSVLAVVLTGMGQDGLRGCESIKAAGGQVLAQDEATSVVWSMPGAVAKAGLADEILPLSQLGPEIIKRVRRGAGASRQSSETRP